MSEKSEFKTWAIVEVMSHVEYAQAVQAPLFAAHDFSIRGISCR